jgi:hypothetical protein
MLIARCLLLQITSVRTWTFAELVRSSLFRSGVPAAKTHAALASLHHDERVRLRADGRGFEPATFGL